MIDKMMVILNLTILIMLCLKQGSSQNSNRRLNCECNDQNARAEWGSWYSQMCQGTCENSTKSGRAECKVYTNQNTYYTILCDRRVPNGCIDDSSCLGAWGQWGTIELCSATCGFGIQKESRACYKKGFTSNLRFNGCGTGMIDEYRNKTCQRMNNCPESTDTSSTTRASISTTTTTTRSRILLLTTSKQPIKTFGSTVSSTTTIARTETTLEGGRGNFKPKENISQKPPTTLSTTQNPMAGSFSGLETMILAAILGAISLICVTVVALAVTVVFMRRKKHVRHFVVYSNESAGSMLTTVSRERNTGDAYEGTEQYSAPEWPSYRFNPSYREPRPVNDTNHQETAYSSPGENHGVYMDPLKSPNKLGESESVYFSIDDRDK